MSRKSITKKIDDKEYTIKELTIKQIMDLLDSGVNVEKVGQGNKDVKKPVGKSGLKEDIQEYVSAISKIINMTADGFGVDDLMLLAPSEVMVLWVAFKEVNNDFLSILEKLGVLEMLKEVKESIREVLLTNFSRTVATL